MATVIISFILIHKRQNCCQLTASTPGDGHPSSLEMPFITDSYPDRYGYQKTYARRPSQTDTGVCFTPPCLRLSRRHAVICTRGDVAYDYRYFDTVTSGRRRLTRADSDTDGPVRFKFHFHQRRRAFAIKGLWEFSGVPTFVVKGVFFLIIIGITLVSLMQKKLTMPAGHILILGIILALFAFSSLIYTAPIVALSYFQIFAPIIVFLIVMSLSKSLNVTRGRFFPGLCFYTNSCSFGKTRCYRAVGRGRHWHAFCSGRICFDISCFLHLSHCDAARRYGQSAPRLFSYFRCFIVLNHQ